MSFRKRILEYLRQNYPFLMRNERFKSWLNAWMDRENNPMDLFEFYYLISQVAGEDSLIMNIVRENAYHPERSFEENLKDIDIEWLIILSQPFAFTEDNAPVWTMLNPNFDPSKYSDAVNTFVDDFKNVRDVTTKMKESEKTVDDWLKRN